MALALQTPHFPSFPSFTQNFLIAFNTPQPHEVSTPSHRTPPPNLYMYVPLNTNVDDDDDDTNVDDDDQDDGDGDDSDIGGSPFIAMSSRRCECRRNMGLCSRVRMRRPCDT